MSISKILFRLPALLIITALWILSSQSRLPQPETIPGFDKAAHFIAYAALGAAFTLWFSQKSPRERKRNLLFSLCLASLYGVVDELHQYFVPNRSCDILDWIADSLGALAGAGVFLWMVRLWGKQAGKE